jgi:hypothetical protein
MITKTTCSYTARVALLSAAWLVAAVASLAPKLAHAAPGDLDTTFAPLGSVSPYAPPGVLRFLAGSGTQSFATATGVQSTGKIVTASWCGTPPNSYSICVNRATSIGGLDPTFAATVITSTGRSFPSALVVDQADNVWVAGTCDDVTSCVYKIGADGGYFSNIGSNGRVTIPGMFNANSVDLTIDGKLLVGGRCQVATSVFPCAARLLATGIIDPAWNGGAVTLWGNDPFVGALLRNGQVPKIKARADGSVYAAATCDVGTTTARNRVCLAIIAANGQIPYFQYPDGSYDYFYTSYPPNSSSESAVDMFVQPDGSALIVGICDRVTPVARIGCVAKFRPGIGVDSAFASEGYVFSQAGAFGNSIPFAILGREDATFIVLQSCSVAQVGSFVHSGICLSAFDRFGNPSPQLSGGGSTRMIDLEPAGSTTLTAGWFGNGAKRYSGDTVILNGACQAAAGAATSCIARVSLAAPTGPRCSPDINRDGRLTATSDGLLLIRSLLGLTGTTATQGTSIPGVTSATWPTIQAFLNTQCGLNIAP